MSTSVSFYVLVIVWEEAVYVFTGKPVTILKALKEEDFFDYFKEDIEEFSIRTTQFKFFEEDLANLTEIQNRKLYSKGWSIKLKQCKISQ
jgi:hypothetical protein